MTRVEKEQALLNKYKNEVSKRIKGYEKKLKGMVDSQIDAEYNLVVKGVQPKKTYWNKKKEN